MNPSVATLICACGIAGLFYLNRDRSVRTSKALWLPIIWVGIIGSRAVSGWLGITPSSGTNVQLDGSPVDAAISGVLLAAAIAVLIYRKKRVLILVRANWPVLAYLSFCLVSTAWAYYPDVAFKRWTKAIGDLAMALVIVTDAEPVAAVRRLISRVGFVLLPLSVLFIKYYGDLGRGYTPDGEPMNTGVTTNKNSLGLIVLVISLGALWNVRYLFIDKDEPNRRRRLAAQCTLLAFGLALFNMADSATCTACFMLGATLILTTGLSSIRRHPSRAHTLCLGILLAGGVVFLFGGDAGVAHALGRKENLTGRTDIWAAVIPTVPSPIVGAGFESYWISPSAETFRNTLRFKGWWHPENLNEAHNGYIETYLNLGGIGICLITLILVSGYRRAVAAFRLYPELGSVLLAYIAMAAIYSITEAGFRILNPCWFFLLLGVLGASAITSGVVNIKKPKSSASHISTGHKSVENDLIPESQVLYAARSGLSLT
jgi:exopolysaccharide production protein ExoQ